MISNHPHPIIVPPCSSRELKFIGITHKLIPQQTDSGYYLFEFEFYPESGNRLRMHQYEDKVVYVLEGAIEIRLDDQMLQSGTGGVAHLPKQIPHALYNPLKTTS